MSDFERRTAHRVPCLTYGHELSGRSLRAVRATNISEGGAYIRCLEGGVLLEGEVVSLELRLPDGEAVWVRGRVVEQVEETLFDGAAVAFDALPGSDRLRLRAFVEAVRRRRLKSALAGLRDALGMPRAAA
ncbi:MAG: PilZ domain-containing protein [Myxococcales bacterium]|nr:PilZ domain-containing protein [Myxococcales bacterium]